MQVQKSSDRSDFKHLVVVKGEADHGDQDRLMPSGSRSLAQSSADRNAKPTNPPTSSPKTGVKHLEHSLEATGDITTDNILQSIFHNFCIGK